MKDETLAEEDGMDWGVRTIWADTISSIRFLSRLPVDAFAGSDLPDFKQSSYTFPLAGLLIALPAAVVLFVLDFAGLPAPVVSLLFVLAMVIVTGALHEDGLADVADGFWGGHTKERKLEIMRDSAIGTYGTLALVLAVLLRVALISAVLMQLGGGAAALLVVALASVSRFAILPVWSGLEPARTGAATNSKSRKQTKDAEGLSARYGAPKAAMDLRALLLTLPAVILIIWSAGITSSIAAIMLCIGSIYLMISLARKHIGGHTGDVLGATQQITELGLYLGLVIAI